MTLPDRPTVQAVGRPEFAKALAQQGRPVIIRRPGQPDVQQRALLIPATSQARQGEKPASPEFASLPWKVFTGGTKKTRLSPAGSPSLLVLRASFRYHTTCQFDQAKTRVNEASVTNARDTC